MKRKDGGRRLVCIEDFMNDKKWTRKIHNGEHRRANNCSKRHWKNQQSKNRDVGCKTRKEKCKEKQLHGNKDEKKTRLTKTLGHGYEK